MTLSLRNSIRQAVPAVIGTDLWYKIRKEIHTKRLQREIGIFPQESGVQPFPGTISVVIPTFQGAGVLSRCVASIRKQRLVQSPEIIVTDSGSTDGTPDLARSLGALVVPSENKPFNHGRSRTYGASFAKGDILVFTVQDAELVSENSLFNLVSTFSGSPSIAATTGRQVPRDDADPFAKWQTIGIYRSLYLDDETVAHRVPTNTRFENLSLSARRRLSFLDNVYCAVRKDVFDMLGGFPQIDISEDTQLAVNLVNKGYSVCYAGSALIRHSHTRPAMYFLKRYYIGYRRQLQLFGVVPHTPFSSLEEVVTAYPIFVSKNKNLFQTAEELINEAVQIIAAKTDASVSKTSLQFINEQFAATFADVQASSFPFARLSRQQKLVFRDKMIMSLLGKHLAELAVAKPREGQKIPTSLAYGV